MTQSPEREGGGEGGISWVSLSPQSSPPVGGEEAFGVIFHSRQRLLFRGPHPWEPGDLDRRPSRRIDRKIGGIDLIDPNEIAKILQEDGGLYHLSWVRPLGLQDLLDILENRPGLLPDIPTHQISGRWIDGDLTGDKHKMSGLDGLGIRANGMGRSLSMDYLLFHVSSSHNRRISATLLGYNPHRPFQIPPF